MKIVVISLNNPNVYPGLYHLAQAFAQAGAEVEFLSSLAPTGIDSAGKVPWISIPKLSGPIAKIPVLRGNYHGIFGLIRHAKPDWIIAQHEYLLPALAYKALGNRAKVAGYFSDHYKGLWHTELLKRVASSLDAYIDVCDIRLEWRRQEWPQMRCRNFVIRNSSMRGDSTQVEPHNGPAKIIFTSSRYTLGLNRDRIARFLSRLCENGISVDWYLPGSPDIREIARSLLSHSLYSVRDPVEKPELFATLTRYDVGLHWAPMAEKDHDPHYFLSAASNKIGEYALAGLVIAHAGNPGLSYLPDSSCVVFDPTNPELGADQLTAAISSREVIEGKRNAALRFQQEEFNFEAQAAPFIQYIMGNEKPE